MKSLMMPIAMRRTLFKIIITLFCLQNLLHAEVAQPPKPFHIFMVLWHGASSMETGFLNYLHEKKIPFTEERHDCKGDRSVCHGLVSEIRRMKPDLIYVWGTPALEEIAGTIDTPPSQNTDYIQDIPIVALGITSPVQSRVIVDLQRPGRNVTGVIHVPSVDIQLKTMTTYMPKLKRIAALYNPLEKNGYYQIQHLKELCALSHIKVIELPIPVDKGVPQAQGILTLIETAHKEDAQILYLPSDTFLSLHMKEILEWAHHRKILTFASTESHYWYSQPLLGVFNRFVHVGMFGGKKAASILRDHMDPALIPFETLPKGSVMISKSAYKAIDYPPPLSMLRFAHICE